MTRSTINEQQATLNVSDNIAPENYSTKDDVNMSGIIYREEQDNIWRSEVEITLKNGIIGILKPNTPYDAVNYPYPKPWVQGDAALYEKYDINAAGFFPSTKDVNGNPLEITQQDLDGNSVQIWITNGIAEIVKKSLSQASLNIRIWSAQTYEINEQVIKDNLLYITLNGAGVDDVPGISPIWMPLKTANEIFFTSGFYLTGTGQLSSAAWMKTSNYVAFKDEDYGAKYTLSRFSDINYRSIFFFDENYNFISSLDTQIIERPQGAKYYRISHEESETIDFYKLPKYEITVTQQYTEGIDFDFTDLQKATDYANSLGYPCLIKIIGEVVLTDTWKNLNKHIYEGVSASSSVIKFISNNELLQTTVSTFRNLKFRREGVTEGYCLHPDYAGEGVVEFDNCEIENTMGACIGSGSHSNQTLRLKNTSLKSISYGQHLSPVLYWHNNVSNVTGKQRLELLNCTIFSDYERPLQISDQNLNLGDGLNRTSEILAINTRFYGELFGLDNMLIAQPAAVGSKTVAGNIKLDPMSGNNNISVLNF